MKSRNMIGTQWAKLKKLRFGDAVSGRVGAGIKFMFSRYIYS